MKSFMRTLILKKNDRLFFSEISGYFNDGLLSLNHFFENRFHIIFTRLIFRYSSWWVIVDFIIDQTWFFVVS